MIRKTCTRIAISASICNQFWRLLIVVLISNLNIETVAFTLPTTVIGIVRKETRLDPSWITSRRCMLKNVPRWTKTELGVTQDFTSQPRRQTAVEKRNQDFKDQRLKDKMKRKLEKFTLKHNKGEDLPQVECDAMIGICAAANEWENYSQVVVLMEKNGLSLQETSYRQCLHECFSVGNGVSAKEIFDKMQAAEIKINANDIQLVVLALCRQNTYQPGLWKEGLQLLQFAGKNDIAGEMKIEAYNAILSAMDNEKKWQDALSLVNMMKESKKFHPRPNISTYHNVLSVLVSSKKVERAKDLLLSLPKQGINPSMYSYEIVLPALMQNDHRGKNWRQAVELLKSMVENRVPIPIEMYNRVISSCSKARKTNEAMSVFALMKEQKMKPDTVTYNSLISACANDGLARDALRLLEKCKEEEGFGPDVITYTNTIRACAKSKMSTKALQLLDDAKKAGISLDAFIYTAVINVCAKDRKWRMSLDLLKDMKKNNVIANQHTYSAVINALGNCGEWERAVEMLNQMKEKGMQINVITYNSAIAAIAKASRRSMHDESSSNTEELWKRALDVLDEMKSDRLWPDKYSYSSAISCCASAARYREAIDLIRVMQNGPAKIRPNKIAYTGAITACARAGEWEHALELFNEMQDDHIRYDVFVYNALISSFTNGGKPDMAFGMWHEMCSKPRGIQPDVITLTNVVASLERAKGKDNLSKMDSVFQDAVERQIILPDDSMDTMWEIDLSGMSLPVARAACRYIMQRLFQVTSECQDLMLITGVGKNHLNQGIDVITDGDSKRSNTALREYVREILRQDFDPPLYSSIPNNAAGIVQVNKDIIEQWMEKQR
mmetsp:Transcript_25730/g.31706  ORF Transcript_25730/g.31706 Transcript_25730/m.31706 type:complete len:838 (+) Transcript_25730:143-2656(+)